ncbi:hypothetical protein Taro_034939 [Colocasia esculenta]|uniref:Uncharacterized protein n=1 Tax=Colocasia esculenta TaxID=4460 RepID=A0A843W915_COLES|nr:hypothetical protein [Colocasia esculenta]
MWFSFLWLHSRCVSLSDHKADLTRSSGAVGHCLARRGFSTCVFSAWFWVTIKKLSFGLAVGVYRFCHGSVDTPIDGVDIGSESLKLFHENRVKLLGQSSSVDTQVDCVDTTMTKADCVDTTGNYCKTGFWDSELVSTHRWTVSTPLEDCVNTTGYCFRIGFWDSHLVSTHRWTVSTPL